MSGGQQGAGGDDKNSMQILWIIFGLFLVGAGIWWGFGEQLKQAFLFIKTWELKLFKYLFDFIHVAPNDNEVGKSLVVAESITPNMLTPAVAYNLAETAGRYIRYPVIIFIAFCGYKLYGKNIKVKYRKRYSMKSLMMQEKSVWPAIEVVSKVDLVEMDLDEGPWAMAMTPMMFGKKFKILDFRAVPGSGHGRNIKFEAKVNINRTNRVFASQLGRAWRGPEHMAPHRKALFAVFAARGCRDTKIARQIVENLNRSIGAGLSPNYAHVDEMIKKHYKSHLVQEIVNHHAYETTVITSMLLFARQDGVLACADFLWLKPLDRRFWYILSSVGRQTPFVEVAGIHAHWLAEKALGRMLTVPFIQEATKAMQSAINDIIYVPTQEEKEALLKKHREEKIR